MPSSTLPAGMPREIGPLMSDLYSLEAEGPLAYAMLLGMVVLVFLGSFSLVRDEWLPGIVGICSGLLVFPGLWFFFPRVFPHHLVLSPVALRLYYGRAGLWNCLDVPWAGVERIERVTSDRHPRAVIILNALARTHRKEVPVSLELGNRVEAGLRAARLHESNHGEHLLSATRQHASVGRKSVTSSRSTAGAVPSREQGRQRSSSLAEDEHVVPRDR